MSADLDTPRDAVPPRDFGKLEGTVEALGEDVFELQAEVKALREELKPVIAMANRVEGGVRALFAVGSISGAVGAVIATIIAKLKVGL
jgi:hypothetical protein